jgi:uncharacterized protein (TIGR02677 family)
MTNALDPPERLGVETGSIRDMNGNGLPPTETTETPVAGVPAHGGIGRPHLHERLLDADELDQLQVLRAAVEPSAPIYAAILSVLVAAKERYQVEVRTEQLAAELSQAGHDVSHLAQQLVQLEDWGAVTWTQDTNRVARLEEFRRRRELWHLTPAGQAAHDAVVRVLGAAEQSGSLQRALFRDIRENLEDLAAAVDDGDATATYLRLRDLDGSLRDLAANARDFHATMGELRREHEVAPERFLAYKHLLIDYLQQFLDEVIRHRLTIAARISDVERRGVDRVVQLATEGDDSAGLFVDVDLAARWNDRWEGLVAWFRPGLGRPSGVEELSGATTSAIRDLMALLRRLTESATRPITRASELRHLARWFLRSDADEAHRLFDASFGLAQPIHLAAAMIDPDAESGGASWWEADPVEVPVTLRRYGKRAAPPPPRPADDFSGVKEGLADEHGRYRAARAEAASGLGARPVEDRRLPRGEFALLLELLDRGLHRRPLAGEFAVEVEAEGVRLSLATADVTTHVHGPGGALTLDGLALEVQRA